MKKDDCIFCRIANGEIGSNTVYEDEDFRVILDLNPGSKGHMLILPKEHFDDLFELSDEYAQKLMLVAKKVGLAARKALCADGINLVQNNGEAAGQTVKHFHMHVIPRYEGDDKGMVNWTPHDSDPEEQKRIEEAIRKQL
ncbi:MAG TPA: HIT family protein [Candidatus Avilachnospira avicola]|nr:HIT family protein [Candidatus Avilachnospira avicola]